jgi:hypothetical protein
LAVIALAVLAGGCSSYRTGLLVAPDGAREAVLVYQLTEQVPKPVTSIFVTVTDPPRSIAPSKQVVSRLASFNAPVFVTASLTAQPTYDPATSATLDVFYRLERRYENEVVLIGSFAYGTEEAGVGGAYRYFVKHEQSGWSVSRVQRTHLDSDCYGNIWVVGPAE